MTIRSRWADSDWTLVRDPEKQAKIKGPKRTPFSHWRRGQSACNDDTIVLGRLGLDFSDGSGKTGKNKGAPKGPLFLIGGEGSPRAMTIRSRWADSDWTLVRDLEKQAKIKGPKRTPFSHWRRGQSACNDDTIALGRLGLDFSEGSGKTGENKGAQKDPFFSLAERAVRVQ